jgi:hypothetical protein
MVGVQAELKDERGLVGNSSPFNSRYCLMAPSLRLMYELNCAA